MKSSPIEALQSLGRALMLPIAVLPVAGLLLRLGQPDLLDVAFVAAAGDAIFANLGLLFAIGVAVGLARDNHGASGLAGVVCFLVATQGAQALLHVPPEATAGMSADAASLAAAAFKTKALAKLAAPLGILSGLAGGYCYNRFSTIALPEYLAFFGGRRFVPIAAGLVGLVMAGLVGFSYEAITGGVDAASRTIVASGEFGIFVFGLMNRVLIVTGLHHILNNIAWFIVGDYQGATGDLNRFFAGDPTAGDFMTGFFPVIMFGLPAACLAMYHAAPRDRRKAVGGMLMSMALTAFLTGVTEPIEFTFMFLAPVLYAVHAVLTGIAGVVMSLLDVKLGFGFSAGLFDYVLNFDKATRPLLLIPVGLVYALVYYGVFRWAIVRFDLKTPGRDTAIAAPAVVASGARGEQFVAALGGAANLASVDACTTRLRLVLVDPAAADEARLRTLGAKGFVRPSEKALQVVLGPVADQVAGEIRAAADAPRGASAAAVAAQATSSHGVDAEAWRAALGGAANLQRVAAQAGRLCLDLVDPNRLDEAALARLGSRGVARVDGGAQVLTAEAAAVAAAIS